MRYYPVMGDWAPVLGDARTADFLGTGGKLELPKFDLPPLGGLKAPSSPGLFGIKTVVNRVGSGIVTTGNKALQEKARRAKVIRDDARATANANTEYRKQRAAETKSQLALNTAIGKTSAGKAGIDWGTLPAFVGLVGGGAVGGPAGAAAGLAKGVQQSHAGTFNPLSLDLGASGEAAGMAVAHELLEVEELAGVVDEGKRIYQAGVDVSDTIKAEAGNVRDAIDTTLALAMTGDPGAIASLGMLQTAVNERADGTVRERETRVPLSEQGMLRQWSEADKAAVMAVAREVFSADWAVMKDGELVRLLTGKVPRGARWVVRGRTVEAA